MTTSAHFQFPQARPVPHINAETAAQALVTELLAVCKKHNLSLSHEDTGGLFLIKPYNEKDAEWLSEAFAKVPKDTITYYDTMDRVKKVVAELTGEDVVTLSAETGLTSSDNVDWLEMAGILLQLEEEFCLEFGTEDVQRFTTIGGVTTVVMEHLAKGVPT